MRSSHEDIWVGKNRDPPLEKQRLESRERRILPLCCGGQPRAGSEGPSTAPSMTPPEPGQHTLLGRSQVPGAGGSFRSRRAGTLGGTRGSE